MKTLLAISFFPAFLPPRSGGEVRLFGLYNALSERYRVILLTSGHVGGEVETLRHNANFLEVRVPKGPEFNSMWAELREHAGAGDLSAPCLAALAPQFTELHQQYLKHYGPADVIVHESPFLVGYDLFLGFDKKPRIYNSYNVEADVYAQLHKDNESSLISDLVRDCEAMLCANAQVVTVCSPQDGSRFRELYGYEGPTELVANGIDGFVPPEPATGDKRLVFIGSGHLPNVIAARFIVETLAPALPDYEFHIMGRCWETPSAWENVVVHGPVDEDEKRALFRSALACVNPMVEGGGSSLKITDLAANGVPIISTDMGVRGFEFRAGTHYARLDVQDFAEGLPGVLADRTRLRCIAGNAASHVRAHFTWPAIAERMDAAIVASLAALETRTCFTVLNDYDPFKTVGGGATRIAGLYAAVSETAKVVVLCFAAGGYFERREECDGRVLLLGIPKTEPHRQAEIHTNSLHHISVVDILAIREAPANPILSLAYECAAGFSDLTLCEHPYLVALPQRLGQRFVYSSQNFELELKRTMLARHPMRQRLLTELAMAESYATGCADLVVAVSQDDARVLGGAFPLTGPIVNIPNGAAEPVPMTEALEALPGRNAVFLGSAHMPNIEAAHFIVGTLAPSHPDVTFHIVGSACLGLDSDFALGPNVKLWGLVDDQTKADLLGRCALALNPMSSGSGSNVKVADYLKNGLRVLSTAFGARGYDEHAGSDIVLCRLEAFGDELRRLLEEKVDVTQDNAARRARFDGELSMYAFGKRYAALLHDKLKERPRLLFVTYRYNDPPLGGGEVYLNRLIKFAADAGYEVDVVAPAMTTIEDRDRFASEYPSTAELGAIPVGHPRIRCARFPLGPVPPERDGRVAEFWRRQPAFERKLFTQLAGNDAKISSLAWGWVPFDGDGRWVYDRFGLVASRAGRLRLVGSVPGARYLRISAADGTLLADVVADGAFGIDLHVPAGIVSCEIYTRDSTSPPDPRPLAAYVQSVLVDEDDLLQSAPFHASAAVAPEKLYAAMHIAATQTRHPDLRLSEVRGPFSDMLENYLNENVGKYDLLVTHNAVFRTATRSIELARAAGVPSILVPLLHLEDDYYHFPDVLAVCQTADKVLASPKAACKFLEEQGCNVAYRTPGIDVTEAASKSDIASFRALCPGDQPFFLVLGRKAPAKGYQEVIRAVSAIRSGHDVRLVMIGPDDDHAPVTESFVSYLGQVDRDVVRGALASCIGLVNMSSSESFGIVVLEAGLARVPVIANRACASFGDLVVDGSNGFLVSVEELPDRMSALVGDRALRTRMGKAGRAAAKMFDWQKIGATFVAQCNELSRRRSTVQ